MKLLVVIFAAFIVCFVVIVEAQQSTLKTTRKLTTTSKPSTSTKPKPNLSTTTTRQLTTTRKLNATTTAKRNATTTTKPATFSAQKSTLKTTTTLKSTSTPKQNLTTTTTRKLTTKPVAVPVFSLCRDTNSTAATGRIQLVKNTQTSASSPCTFDIVAPLGQQIQISCSVVSLDNYTSTMSLIGLTESLGRQPIANRIYYSVENTLSLYSEFVETDEFNCKWDILSKGNTTQFYLCRHGLASSANGSIQSMASNLSDPSRNCVFTIRAPPEYQIGFSCSVLNLTRYYSFRINGTVAVFDSYERPEIKQTYYSTALNEVILTSEIFKYDSIKCNWTTTRRENNQTNFKLCRDEETTVAMGTITSIRNDTTPFKGCSFLIKAPPEQQIGISCSSLNFPYSFGVLYNLQISGTIEKGMSDYNDPITNPPENETFYSTSENNVTLSSILSHSDWFSCNWTTNRKVLNKTNPKLCRDQKSSSPNGTITPLKAVHLMPPSQCTIVIYGHPDQQIQFFCSDINYSSGYNPDTGTYYGHSGFEVAGFGEAVIHPSTIVINRIYYSYPGYGFAFFAYGMQRSSDWFNCSWSILPKSTTTNFKLCREKSSSSANGTITPLQSTKLMKYHDARYCKFDIDALPNQQIAFSCSAVDDTIRGLIDGIIGFDEGLGLTELVLNKKYYSKYNYLKLGIEVNDGDWFNCKWTVRPVPRANRITSPQTQLLLP